jgi:uncharacterized membrane protein (UPF0127 family)
MQHVRIENLTRPLSTPVIAGLCDTFWTKFKGLMFVREILPNEGLLFQESAESRIDSSIHMLFMNFDIAVVWLDQEYHVVDVKLAKRWHLAYVPLKAAQYTLEMHPDQLRNFQIGDVLSFETV